MPTTTSFKITTTANPATPQGAPTPAPGQSPPVLVFAPNQGSSQMYVNDMDVGVGVDMPMMGQTTLGRWDLLFRYNAPYWYELSPAAQAALAIVDPTNGGLKVFKLEDPTIETQAAARQRAITLGITLFQRVVSIQGIILLGDGIRAGMEFTFNSTKRGIINKRLVITNVVPKYTPGVIENTVTGSNQPLLTAIEKQRQRNRAANKSPQRIATYIGS